MNAKEKSLNVGSWGLERGVLHIYMINITPFTYKLMCFCKYVQGKCCDGLIETGEQGGRKINIEIMLMTLCRAGF